MIVENRARVNIRRVVEGKIIEGWNVTDSLDLLRDLGVIEYKGFPDGNVT